MASTADYVGRTSDVSAFDGWSDALGKETLLRQTVSQDADPGGQLLTGPAKLSQRFLLTLLTPKGSIRHLPDLGTGFLTDARRGRWRTSLDVRQSFHSAMLDVLRQMRSQETASDRDDERLDEVRIINILIITGDSVSLRLQLYTVAGTSVTFVAPIGVTTN